jgi:glycosyltransferase involved in cell wall biosynthesis
MPVRNGEPWLEHSLASLSSQTLREIEIIALEDGSTDGTPRVLASWPDVRLRVIPTGGIGIGGALTVGLREARAPLVARQDADDLSLPERLEHQVSFLDRNPGIDLVACVADYVDEQGRPFDDEWVRTVRRQQDVALAPDEIRDLMPLTCCVTHGSIVARASVLQAAGGYRAAFSPQEDYDLWLRLLPDANFAKLPERLYTYRVHEGQASSQGKPHNIRRTIGIKLAYLRRVCPWLPVPARLSIAGSGRGVAYYEAVAPDFDFTTARVPSRLEPLRVGRLSSTDTSWQDGWDVLSVTDFAALEEYRRLSMATGLVRVGNFFVKPAASDARSLPARAVATT